MHKAVSCVRLSTFVFVHSCAISVLCKGNIWLHVNQYRLVQGSITLFADLMQYLSPAARRNFSHNMSCTKRSILHVVISINSFFGSPLFGWACTFLLLAYVMKSSTQVKPSRLVWKAISRLWLTAFTLYLLIYPLYSLKTFHWRKSTAAHLKIISSPTATPRAEKEIP